MYRKPISNALVFSAAILSISLLSTVIFAQSAPGDLDLSFGNGGVAVTRGSSSSDFDRAYGMAIQSDGKIVVVGSGNPPSTSSSAFAVVRHNTNGSLDNSFGGTGVVRTPVGDLGSGAGSVAIQSDGKIVVAGTSYDINHLAIVRYHPNGSLDTSFNGTGRVVTAVVTWANATSVLIQADGKIVAAGSVGIVRYTSNGALDTTFNGTGNILIPNSSMALQTDGKIVVADGFNVFRFNPNGSPDTSFNGTGTDIPLIDDSSPYAMALQPDGKVVVVGHGYIVDDEGQIVGFNFTFVRFNLNGSLDTSFGSGGISHIPAYINQNDVSLAIQADAKIVAVSSYNVVRINQNGSLNTRFNGPSILTADPASAVAIQQDGKIVVAGSTMGEVNRPSYDFAVVRYLGESAEVSISGRVTTANGRGLGNAVVTLVDSLGRRRTATTSTFGYYLFNGIPGDTYTISVKSKRYQFEPRTVFADENLSGIDLVSLN